MSQTDSARAQHLAERIAQALFTNASGELAHRLVLESAPPGFPVPRELGGWSQRVAIDRIVGVILEFDQP